MPIPKTVDDRISALVPDIDRNLRRTLQEALCILRDSGSVRGTLINISSALEGEHGLLGLIARAGDQSLRSWKFSKQINQLKGTLMPDEVASDFDSIRECRNRVVHSIEQKAQVRDAEIALNSTLRLCEWFYCKYQNGLRLRTIYADNFQPVTLWGQLVKFDPLFASLLKPITTGLALDEAGESHLREGADPNLLKVEPHRLRQAIDQTFPYNTASTLRLYSAYKSSILFDYQEQRKDARDVLSDALDVAVAYGGDLPCELQILVLDRAAHLANKQADCTDAEKYAYKMLALSQEVHQSFRVATAFQRLGRSHYFRCESDLARGLLEKSLNLFQTSEPKDFKAIAWVQFDLGMLEVDTGNFTSGREWLENSLDLHEKYGDGNEEGAVRVNLAFVLHKLGDKDAAHAHMAKAKELLRRGNYFRWHLHFWGRLNVDEGNLDTARVNFRESLEIFRDREDKLGIIRSLLAFSWLAAKEGDSCNAVTLLGAEDTLRSKEMDNLPPPPDWKTETDFIVNTARQMLDESAFNAAWLEGMGMTWEQAIKYALV